MPEITNEKEEPKIGKSTVKSKDKKASSKKSTKKDTAKKSSSKATSTKATTKTSKKSSKSAKSSKPKVDNIVKKKNVAIKEETVIEKIKSFLAKIVAMQEENKKEIESKSKKNNINTVKSSEDQNNTINSHLLEYYDLPYRYNETIVKILAQTPKKIFVYWDISDVDKQKYLNIFGEKFFEETYPVLLVHNTDKNYTFEVVINDFANSWYLDIQDAKSKYVIELGRKFKTKPDMINIAITENTKGVIIKNDYIPITVSNTLEVPNDHILFENIPSKALYKNIKNNEETFVNITVKEYLKEQEHTYNVYDMYKEIYKNEIGENGLLELLNPSSMSSSNFK